MRTLLAVGAAITLSAPAFAQTAVPQLPRHDVTLAIGWAGSQYPLAEPYNRWHQSFLGGAGISHYWTDHFRTEVEAAWLSRVNTPSYESVVVNGGDVYFRNNYGFHIIKLSVGQGYQFGRNQWVHPFLAAGVDVDRLRTIEDRAAQSPTVYVAGRAQGTVPLSPLSESETDITVRPFAKAGLKMYVSDRTFFTTEWKFGFFSDGLQHVAWKTGFGFDF